MSIIIDCYVFPGWQSVYENDLYKILENHGGSSEDRSRIIGAEVALWTETVSLFMGKKLKKI